MNLRRSNPTSPQWVNTKRKGIAMIAIIDYGVGNLFSLNSSLKYLGLGTKITNKEADLTAADRIILPGVGAFEDAIAKLNNTGLVDTILERVSAGIPMLGICLGMQLLFEKSFEYGTHQGLGLIKGEIASIEADLPLHEVVNKVQKLKVPHIGWNSLHIEKEDPIFKYIKEGDYVYYVHGFYGRNCVENTIASSIYDIRIPGVVKEKNVYGTQFHPEKSGTIGLNILRAFAEI